MDFKTAAGITTRHVQLFSPSSGCWAINSTETRLYLWLYYIVEARPLTRLRPRYPLQRHRDNPEGTGTHPGSSTKTCCCNLGHVQRSMSLSPPSHCLDCLGLRQLSEPTVSEHPEQNLPLRQDGRSSMTGAGSLRVNNPSSTWS